MFGALSLIAFRIGETVTGELAGGQTMAFTVMSLSQVLQSFNMRSEHSLFKVGFFTNSKLNWAAALSTALVLVVLFTPLAVPFGLISLPLPLYLTALVLILVPLVIMEGSKALGLIRHRG